MMPNITSTHEPARYACEPGQLERDRGDILSIWRSGLSNVGQQRAKYDWFYLGGEAGEPIVSLLRHAGGSQPVGVAAAGRRRAIWKDRLVQAGVLVDLAVVPEHRTLFPALLLQRSLQRAVPENLALLYGFPNPKAVPVFQRVGYAKALDVRRFVRVLRSDRYLRRYLPGWAAAAASRPLDLLATCWDAIRVPVPRTHKSTWTTTVDPRVDSLWASTEKGAGPVLVRDARFLRWRFDRMPGCAFRYLNIEARDGRLEAWFACEDRDGFLMVRDFWTSGGCDRLDPSVVSVLIREARKAGCPAISVEFGGSAKIVCSLESAGFSERGRRPFFAYFGPGHLPVDDANWYVTSADEDE